MCFSFPPSMCPGIHRCYLYYWIASFKKEILIENQICTMPPHPLRGTRNGYMRHSVSVGVSQSTTQESAHLLSKNTDVGSRRKYVTWLSQPRNMVVGQETEAAATKSQRTFLLNRLKPRGVLLLV
ncbi:uncharacterized protein LOC119323885 isoform X2 [Triticum dicoccoides]|uniref:uncharacterized protein LOC119323885 isoform X2 n=1 Tax=Triticum dicoccoides TaxID=85692 RepID=UPI0018914380|nr:uncharacterized protein LOC119323885 isoform X2 [Triticum dicoccoides]